MGKLWNEYLERVKQWCINNLREHAEYGMVEVESLAHAAVGHFNITSMYAPQGIPDWLCEIVDEAVAEGW